MLKSLNRHPPERRGLKGGSIVGLQISSPKVGVATSSGRAYYQISQLLKKMGAPFADLIFDQSTASWENIRFNHDYKVIITTRKERVQFSGFNTICVEDLGDDVGLAKEKLYSILYPPKPSDRFVVGIDPGARTGIAAFMNHREVESSVASNFAAALDRVSALIDNAPDVRKIVKIGCGNLVVAKTLAHHLESRYGGKVTIQLVNESGTSVLRRKRSHSIRGTRDQRAARLIAFREGLDIN